MKSKYNHQTYNWHLEISSKCALKCPRCPRTEYPDSLTPKQLGLSFIQKIFHPEFLRNNVRRITFSGGMGDPIYNTELLEITSYLKSTHPDFQLVIVTNGSYKSQSWWGELGKKLTSIDEVIFSVDGYNQETNNLYRKNSHWDSIIMGIETLAQSPPLVRWSTIAFKFNEQHIEKIKNLAKQHEADHFHLVLSERFGRRYIDPQTGLDPLKPDSHLSSQIHRTQRFKEVFDTHPEKWKSISAFHKGFDTLSDLCLKTTQERFSDSFIMPTCQFGYRGAYIDVDGYYYPCSWVSHPFDSLTSKYDSSKKVDYGDGFAKYRDRLNLHKRTLEEVLNDPLWASFQNDWKTSKSAYITCEDKCLNNNTYLSHMKVHPLNEV